MADIPTVDPNVVIEAQSIGYVRYRSLSTGHRWEVHGTCDHRGDCMIGAVVDGVLIRDRAHLDELAAAGFDSLPSQMDVPISPEFDTCCGDPITGVFTYTELPPV